MPLRSRLVSFARTVLRRRQLDQELDDELRGCLDILAARHERAGLSPDEARRRARLELGGVEQVKEAVRGGRHGDALWTVLGDLHFAARVLVRERRFATTAVLVLGLGLGVNTTFFSIANGVCFRGLPLDEPDRLLHIAVVRNGQESGLSLLDFQELRRAAAPVADVAGSLSRPVTLVDPAGPAVRVQGSYVSGTTFGVAREQAVLGRQLTPDDDRAGAQPVAVIGHTLWFSRYGGDPDVLRRVVDVDGHAASIVGVMPEDFGFPGTTEVWMPLALAPGLAAEPREAGTLGMVARVADRVPVAMAASRIEAIVTALASTHPIGGAGATARVLPINERYLGDPTNPVWIIFMTVGILVVLIAGANVANLTLVWTARRTRELAIRGALGASRARLVRQLLIESSLLAAAGAGTGLATGVLLQRVFSGAVPEGALPPWMHPVIDSRVVLVLAATTTAALLVFGVVPALRASAIDVSRVLKDAGERTSSPRTRRWTTGFLAVQFALTLLLVAFMALEVRSRQPLPGGERAVRESGALTAQIELEGDRYADEASRVEFVERLVARLASRPGIGAVAATTALPLFGAEELTVEIEGMSPPSPDQLPSVHAVGITPGYFDAFDLPILRGRQLTPEDGKPGQASVIVSQRFADVHLGDRDPIGRRIRLAAPEQAGPSWTEWLTIAGVAPTVRQRLTPSAVPVVYRPYRTTPSSALTIVLRSRDNAQALGALREEVAALDPRRPVFRTGTIDRVLDDLRWMGRVSSGLARSITAVALVLALVGLYSVTAHGVQLRAREVAIRMSLGAPRSHVLLTVLRGALRYIAPGVIAGVLLILVWDRLLFHGGQPGVRVSDWQVVASAVAFLVLLGVTAALLPAWRASRADPLEALRPSA